MARPIPRLAPVTNAVRPETSKRSFKLSSSPRPQDKLQYATPPEPSTYNLATLPAPGARAARVEGSTVAGAVMGAPHSLGRAQAVSGNRSPPSGARPGSHVSWTCIHATPQGAAASAEQSRREPRGCRALAPVPFLIGDQRMIAGGPAEAKILDPDVEGIGVGGELPVQRFELVHQRIARRRRAARADDLDPSSIAPENRAKVSALRGTAPASQSRKNAWNSRTSCSHCVSILKSPLRRYALPLTRSRGSSWGRLLRRMPRGNGPARPIRVVPQKPVPTAPKGRQPCRR